VDGEFVAPAVILKSGSLNNSHFAPMICWAPLGVRLARASPFPANLSGSSDPLFFARIRRAIIVASMAAVLYAANVTITVRF
jgi:hypothetical protein